jgi:hypothetical protein
MAVQDSENKLARDVAPAGEAAASAPPAGRRMIVTIGVDRYDEWPGLNNAVSDALGTHALFVALGFEEAVPPILNEAASGRALRELVTDELAMLGGQDSLVVFFAGHGHVRTRLLGGHQTGYLIPADGSRKADSWLRLDVWLDEISQLPPRHILVILDACHSGIALGAVIPRPANDERDRGGTLEQRRSRRVITSALDHERARDDGPIPGHSLFTGCLIEGLPRAFGEPGNAITGSELGVRLQRRVSEFSQHTQTPDVGSFGFDNRGELVIPIPDGPRVAPPARVVAPRGAEPRRIWTLVRRAPVVGDYGDARAALRAPGASGPALAAGLVIVAVGWLTQARAIVGWFLAGMPAYLAWILSPVAVVVGCLYAVCARDLGGRRYRCDPRLRTAAKLVSALAAAVLVVRANREILGERDALVEGYVCGADGHSVVDATVYLVDAEGRRVGEANGTDRSGYVWLSVAP